MNKSSNKLNVMRLEGKVDQLTELMADLIPTVDKLTLSHSKLEQAVNALVQSQIKMANTVLTIEQAITRQTKLQERSNAEMSEMRLSNMKLAGAIEKLVKKNDRGAEFDKRLKRIEKIVLK
jgi:hypothetical protein